MAGKNGTKTGRDSKGRFGAGNPGKPRGAKHQTTLLAERLMGDELEAVARTVIAEALTGNMQAARIVLDKMLPNAKERKVVIAVPDTSTAAGIARAQSAIFNSVATGEITPGEGATLAGILETQRRASVTEELERRIAALETEKTP